MMRAWIVVAMLSACGGATKGTTPGLSKDDAVIEAVLLHEIADAQVAEDEAICLAMRGATDETAVFEAIATRHPTAKRNAECSGGGPEGAVMWNDHKGVRFDVGPVVWVDDATATIDGGGGHRGGATVHERKYTVKRDGSGWKVTGNKPGLTI